VALTPKAFDTLHLLVRSSGHLVEKDELIRTLWPDTVVEEGNLTTNIFLLRKALGQAPEYIETVPKKGYRFVGAVRRLPTGELLRPDQPSDGESEFAARVVGVRQPTGSLDLTYESATTTEQRTAPPSPGEQVTTASWPTPTLITTAALVAFAAAVTYVAIDKAWMSKHQASPPTLQPAAASAAPAAFAPPPHSIAVLPFVNLSGDPRQEYFSDGLTDELLISLAKINELQVAARTSSFSFKGKGADINTIAHKLNVASVLEGSVRRTGNTIRITAQLNDSVTGFQLWSHTYDWHLSNMLQLQSEMANAVVSALKITLLGDVAATIEVGGTHNPEAFDAYLRAEKAYSGQQSAKELQAAISEYTEPIHQDPDFALAYAHRSLALAKFARCCADRRTRGGYLDKAHADARNAIALAPDLADGHLALARSLAQFLDFMPASREYERARALAPGNAFVLREYGLFAVFMGRTEAGLAAIRRSAVLDPLNVQAYFALGFALNIAGRYRDAITALRDGKSLDPNDGYINAQLGFAHYFDGDYRRAVAAAGQAYESDGQICLAYVYGKIGRRADAEAILAKLRTSDHDDFPLVAAYMYLEWGDRARALDWLETAMRHRVPHLVWLKADKQLDPLRREPRFQAIERALKFPD
jgi:TolB-like protein/tetratricopeptide (TPR) repeat protein